MCTCTSLFHALKSASSTETSQNFICEKNLTTVSLFIQKKAMQLRYGNALSCFLYGLDWIICYFCPSRNELINLFFYLCWIIFYSFFKKCFVVQNLFFLINKYHNQSFWANSWFPKAFFSCWNFFRKCSAFMQIRPRLIKYAYICMHYKSIIKSSFLMMFE